MARDRWLRTLTACSLFFTALATHACSTGDGAANSDTAEQAAKKKAAGDSGGSASTMPGIKTVFVILMENHNWSAIKGSASAPYINGTLLAEGAHAEQYFNPAKLHPSEPNYIWLEAGDNLGITTDVDPSASHSLTTTDHLVSQLERAGKSWRSYQEDMVPGTCPVASTGKYAAKHNPMVFFQDVSGSPPSSSNAYCIQNVRPLSELANDLASDQDADYNLITPNLCNDMHGASGCPADRVKAGDDWLAKTVPQIMASEAYKDAGAIFITWDESEGGDHPIGMIVLSSFARAGYTSHMAYTHSSTLRSIEDIFALAPLRDAARASSLLDLFSATSAAGLDGGTGSLDGHTLPNTQLTPGNVLTTNVAKICQTGYSASVRSLSSKEKAQVAAAYNYTGPSSGVEYDHLISLELGGSNDATNIWPEPIADAHIKDGLENSVRAKVCSGAMSLPDAQARISQNWVQLWNDLGQPGKP